MDFESIAMKLIVSSSEARSKAMESITLAKAGAIAAARAKCGESSIALSIARKFQTEISCQEAAGIVSLLIVHAQDHLMNALTIRDMANEFIDLYENIMPKGPR